MWHWRCFQGKFVFICLYPYGAVLSAAAKTTSYPSSTRGKCLRQLFRSLLWQSIDLFLWSFLISVFHFQGFSTPRLWIISPMFSKILMVFLFPSKLDKQIRFLSNAFNAERIVIWNRFWRLIILHGELSYKRSDRFSHGRGKEGIFSSNEKPSIKNHRECTEKK